MVVTGAAAPKQPMTYAMEQWAWRLGIEHGGFDFCLKADIRAPRLRFVPRGRNFSLNVVRVVWGFLAFLSSLIHCHLEVLITTYCTWSSSHKLVLFSCRLVTINHFPSVGPLGRYWIILSVHLHFICPSIRNTAVEKCTTSISSAIDTVAIVIECACLCAGDCMPLPTRPRPYCNLGLLVFLLRWTGCADRGRCSHSLVLFLSRWTGCVNRGRWETGVSIGDEIFRNFVERQHLRGTGLWSSHPPNLLQSRENQVIFYLLTIKVK